MRFFALVLVGFLIAGCGSGGSSSPSPYRGSWAGIASVASGSSIDGASNIVLSVDSKGRLTGTWSDPLGSGALSGSVTNGGTLSLNIADPGPPSSVMNAKGVTSITAGGEWTGSLPITNPELAGMSIVFQASRQ